QFFGINGGDNELRRCVRAGWYQLEPIAADLRLQYDRNLRGRVRDFPAGRAVDHRVDELERRRFLSRDFRRRIYEHPGVERQHRRHDPKRAGNIRSRIDRLLHHKGTIDSIGCDWRLYVRDSLTRPPPTPWRTNQAQKTESE